MKLFILLVTIFGCISCSTIPKQTKITKNNISNVERSIASDSKDLENLFEQLDKIDRKLDQYIALLNSMKFKGKNAPIVQQESIDQVNSGLCSITCISSLKL